MSDNEALKVSRVDDLCNFPFKTFQEFKKANMDGLAQPGVDRSVALNWVQKGIYAPRIMRIQSLLLSFLPYIAVLGFIIWVIASKSWLMLFAIPVFLIAFFVFHPSSAMTFGIIRNILIGMSFIGLLYACIVNVQGLLALCLTLVLIWYAQSAVYKKAINCLTKAVSEHEDLLCGLWQGKAMNVMFSNGDSYCTDWKIENGQTKYYKNDE